MPSKNGRKPLTREGEPTQETKQGVEISIPRRDELLDALGKVIRREPSEPPR